MLSICMFTILVVMITWLNCTGSPAYSIVYRNDVDVSKIYDTIKYITLVICAVWKWTEKIATPHLSHWSVMITTEHNYHYILSTTRSANVDVYNVDNREEVTKHIADMLNNDNKPSGKHKYAVTNLKTCTYEWIMTKVYEPLSKTLNTGMIINYVRDLVNSFKYNPIGQNCQFAALKIMHAFTSMPDLENDTRFKFIKTSLQELYNNNRLFKDGKNIVESA